MGKDYIIKKRNKFNVEYTFIFLIKVLIPAVIVLYLMYTEKYFISSFKKDVEILFFGEVMFISLHMIFTYVLLPTMWFMDILKIFFRDSIITSAF